MSFLPSALIIRLLLKVYSAEDSILVMYFLPTKNTLLVIDTDLLPWNLRQYELQTSKLEPLTLLGLVGLVSLNSTAEFAVFY